MLKTVPHEHNYLIDHLDEIEAVIVDLSFNVQNDHWLVYYTACGHKHLDLPETDERISIGEPDPFHQTTRVSRVHEKARYPPDFLVIAGSLLVGGPGDG